MSTYKLEIVWANVLFLMVYHIFALHGVYFLLTLQVHRATFAWTSFLLMCSNFGVGPGVHRLWSHRAYKAKLPLRILLMILFTVANQNSIYVCCRDHRAHHKFTDTNADPHSINRGFFFAHIGWLLCKKHPDVITKGQTVDMNDLAEDKVVMFQHRHFFLLSNTISFILPTLIPWYFWSENLYISFCFATMCRYLISLHATWTVNSIAHLWGYKPYDKNIKPVESWYVAALSGGEGWHNYHHTFPWDYKARELDTYTGNINTAFIDFMAKIGWAYDLKVASPSIIEKRKLRNDKNVIKKEEKQLVFVENYVQTK